MSFYKYKILVTARAFGSTSDEAQKILEKAGCEIIQKCITDTDPDKQLLPLVKNVDGMIVGIHNISRKILAVADKLKVISVHATGCDGVDMEYATKKGIAVTNCPGINSKAVAELGLAFIFNLARQVMQADKSVKSGKWDKFTGVNIYDKTLGIIGLGHVGKELVKRVEGFSMNILAVDINADEKFADTYGFTYVGLERLLMESDFIILSVPLTHQTKGMIGMKELELIKNTAYLVNVARGALIDEKALYQALVNKEIAGVALDVFEIEPPKDSPLLSLENVITTPHIGAFTIESITNTSKVAARNLVDVLQDKCPRYLVNNISFFKSSSENN